MNLISQIRNNLLAVISLTVAVSSLSYNTYRNELTEENRNVRHASFELLKELNQLQLLIDYAHYDNSSEHGNPIQGWGHVMYIKDMSYLISKPIVFKSENLKKIWGSEWANVQKDESSNKNVTAAINKLRISTREYMQSLN